MAADAKPLPPLRAHRILALLLAVGLLLEVLSRVGVPRALGRPYQSFDLYRWSPYGLTRNNPELTNVAFWINDSGFREVRSYSQHKPPRTLRVMLLGGSVLYSGLGGALAADARRVDSAHTISQYLTRDLEGDPAFADVHIEVINAAVNFNRMVEVSTAYLGEWIDWEPDFVVVGSTLNSFATQPQAGDSAAGRNADQAWHPWRRDFERQANDHGAVALLERAWLTACEYSALAGLARKAASTAVDMSRGRLATAGVAAQLAPPRPTPSDDPAEWNAMLQTVLPPAVGMARAGSVRGQRVVFFWEHMLADVYGYRHISPTEQTTLRLSGLTEPPMTPWALDPNHFYTWFRRHFGEALRADGIPLIDPLDALRDAGGTVFNDYGHYTPNGNELMARVIAASLHDELAARAAALRAAP